MHGRLDAIFGDYASTRGPGLVVGVSAPGMLAYRRAFGRSSVENGAPNTLQTRMRIGSTTKQFTCFAVLLLAEDGLLSIDDDIRAHLPELPAYDQTVRIRHLMSNSSGVRCYLDLLGILAGMDRTLPAPLQTELQLHQGTVNFAPGQRLLYCNGGYLLLSLLIERVSGQSLSTFFSERIFGPLGLSRTAFEPYDTSLLEDVATLHQRVTERTYHRGTLGVALCGDGAIISDVDDMLRWLAHMDSPRVGSPSTWETFLSAGTQTEHGYGFGLMHLKYRGVQTMQHGGTVFGGRCQALKVPGRGIDSIIISNASDILPSELTERVLDVLLEGELGEPLTPASAERAAAFTGTFYSSQTGDAVTIVTKDGRAFVDGENAQVPLYETPHGFKTNMYSLGFEIRPAQSDPSRPVAEIELLQGGSRSLLQRVGDSGPGNIAPFAGAYVNDDCAAEAFIADGAQPQMRIRSRYGSSEYRLEHLAGDAWYALLEHSWFSVKLRMEFSQDKSGTRFQLSSERTKKLGFLRSVPART